MTKSRDPTPYVIERLTDDRVVVILPKYLDEPRKEEHATELQDLVEGDRSIAVDATRAVAISSDWLRLLYRLTAIAQQAGKTVGIVGLSEALLESADVLGIRSQLELFAELREVWEA